ncbi:Protein LIPS-9 [Aphelenchoides avenae]|nr:Protein LIPS-9 [Aphelenchus avenae]
MLRLCVVLIALFAIGETTFTPNFRNFLKLTFGAEAEKNLSRVDVGVDGSFGGGNHKALLRTKKVPTIFIHGNGGYAGNMLGNRNFFIAKGYKDEEVYATTYGFRKSDSIRCEYVKSVRRLIIAVNRFCGSQRVNVLGHSRGVMITRKAILGGKCVDTGENIGAPLTSIVLNYVSLAGSNHGALYCASQVGVHCNNVTGVSPGSVAVKDINSKLHYEGRNTYALLSKADTVAGYLYKGIILTQLPGANKTFVYDKYNHGEVNTKTFATQLAILSGKP